MKDIKDCDAVILAVAHDRFKKLTKEDISKLYADNGKKKVLSDIKGILNRKEYQEDNYLYWRL